jgi:hypothetical protein
VKAVLTLEAGNQPAAYIEIFLAAGIHAFVEPLEKAPKGTRIGCALLLGFAKGGKPLAADAHSEHLSPKFVTNAP